MTSNRLATTTTTTTPTPPLPSFKYLICGSKRSGKTVLSSTLSGNYQPTLYYDYSLNRDTDNSLDVLHQHQSGQYYSKFIQVKHFKETKTEVNIKMDDEDNNKDSDNSDTTITPREFTFYELPGVDGNSSADYISGLTQVLTITSPRSETSTTNNANAVTSASIHEKNQYQQPNNVVATISEEISNAWDKVGVGKLGYSDDMERSKTYGANNHNNNNGGGGGDRGRSPPILKNNSCYTQNHNITIQEGIPIMSTLSGVIFIMRNNVLMTKTDLLKQKISYVLTKLRNHPTYNKNEMIAGLKQEINQDFKRELTIYTSTMRNTILNLYSLPSICGVPLMILVNDSYHDPTMETQNQDQVLEELKNRLATTPRTANKSSSQEVKTNTNTTTPTTTTATITTTTQLDPSSNCFKLEGDEFDICEKLLVYASQLVCSQQDFLKYLRLNDIQMMLYGGIDFKTIPRKPLFRDHSLNLDLECEDVCWSIKGRNFGRETKAGLLDRICLMFMSMGDESTTSDVHNTVMNLKALQHRKRVGLGFSTKYSPRIGEIQRANHSDSDEDDNEEYTSTCSSEDFLNSTSSSHSSSSESYDNKPTNKKKSPVRSLQPIVVNPTKTVTKSWRNMRNITLLWNWLLETGKKHERTHSDGGGGGDGGKN